jgi:hypothetical protein
VPRQDFAEDGPQGEHVGLFVELIDFASRLLGIAPRPHKPSVLSSWFTSQPVFAHHFSEFGEDFPVALAGAGGDRGLACRYSSNEMS